jgi:uncharacterized RDD family membrane protein YckC
MTVNVKPSPEKGPCQSLTETGSQGVDIPKLAQSFPVCGKWQRLGALALDMLLLIALGFTALYALKDFYGELALYDRWIGLITITLYFGIWNSEIGQGQSPGKRILKIQVVNKQGTTLSLVKSLGRSVVLLSPFFYGHVIYPYQTGIQLYNSLVTIYVIAFGPGIILFYFFNERTRQSLHDFAVGSVVVKKNRMNVWVAPPATQESQLNKAGILMALSFLFSIYQGYLSKNILEKTFSSEEMAEIHQIYRTLNKKEDYAWAAVTQGLANSYLVVEVIFKNNPSLEDWDYKMEEVARRVRAVSPLSKELKVLVVRGEYGLSFGLVRANTTYQKNFTPEYWYSK